MNKKYKSDALEAIHETVQGMFNAELLDEKTMREFDESCLTPHELPICLQILTEQGTYGVFCSGRNHRKNIYFP